MCHCDLATAAAASAGATNVPLLTRRNHFHFVCVCVCVCVLKVCCCSLLSKWIYMRRNETKTRLDVMRQTGMLIPARSFPYVSFRWLDRIDRPEVDYVFFLFVLKTLKLKNEPNQKQKSKFVSPVPTLT